jgi:hypothetical protein
VVVVDAGSFGALHALVTAVTTWLSGRTGVRVRLRLDSGDEVEISCSTSTATRSAHPPCSATPTTGVPAAGPVPSACTFLVWDAG